MDIAHNTNPRESNNSALNSMPTGSLAIGSCINSRAANVEEQPSAARDSNFGSNIPSAIYSQSVTIRPHSTSFPRYLRETFIVKR